MDVNINSHLENVDAIVIRRRNELEATRLVHDDTGVC